MIRVLTFCWLAVTAGLAAAQMPPPSTKQVDKSEVLRWGDRVVESGTGLQSGASMMFTAAMAPPEDDSDMWYVTVFVEPKKKPTDPDSLSDKLLKDFQNSELAAFVAPPTDQSGKPIPGKRAWAHFNAYKHGDNFQLKRFEDYQIGFDKDKRPVPVAFPIIIIQPPRNAKFGPPALVVDRIEAREIAAGPKAIHTRIVKVVELYVKKLHDSGYTPPVNYQSKTSAEKPAAIINDDIPPADDSAYSQTTPNKPVSPTENVIGGPWGPDPPGPTPFNPTYPNYGPQPAPQPGPYVPNVSSGEWDFTGPRFATLGILLLTLMKAVELIGPRFNMDVGLVAGLRKLLEGFIPAPSVINQAAPSQPVNIPPPGYVINSAGQMVPELPVPSARSRSPRSPSP